MADEPGGWELHRSIEQMRKEQSAGFARLDARLDKLVTAETFERERQRVDEKFRDLSREIVKEREERKTGDERQQATLDKLTANIRWTAAALLLPIALFIANLVIVRGG